MKTLTGKLDVKYEMITTENGLGEAWTIVRIKQIGPNEHDMSFLGVQGRDRWCIVSQSEAKNFDTPIDAFQAVIDYCRVVQKHRLKKETTTYYNQGHAVVDEEARCVDHVLNPIDDGDWRRPKV